jgi:hypothetical protein
MSFFGQSDRRKDATKVAISLTGFARNQQRLLQPIGVEIETYWRDEYVLGFVGGCVMAIGLNQGLKNELGPMIEVVLQAHSGLARDALAKRYSELFTANQEPFHGAQFKGMDYAAFALGFGPEDHPFIKNDLAAARDSMKSGEPARIVGLVDPSSAPDEFTLVGGTLLDSIFMKVVEKRLIKR